MNNREFAEKDKAFQEACRRAGIPPTPRQASKWRSQNGKAWQQGRHGQIEEVELKKAS